MNKKGIAFTLTAIILLFLILTTFGSYGKFNLREKSFIIENRVTTMKNFISDLERDANRALYIAAYRALLGMNEYITLTSDYVEDTETVFMELVLNGTANGITMNVTNSSHISLWEMKLQQQADDIGMDIAMFNETITITQTSPWMLKIELDFMLNASDQKDLAEWEKNEHIERTIGLTGFEDPIVIIGSLGLFSQTVQRSPYEHFFNSATNDTTNLSAHIEDSYYIESTRAPNYLMRFEGNTTGSSYGIESLVDVEPLIAFNLQKNKSIVDYIYWSDSNPVKYHVKNMSAWVYLDNVTGRLLDYEINNIVE